MIFPSYRLSKTWLNHSLESAVSESPSTVNGLMKSGWEHFYHIFWSLREEMICKISHLLKLEILRCLLTHWLPMTRILFGIVRICSSLFKCNYLKNGNLFRNFLFHLWNIYQMFKIFAKKMIVIANVFPKLQTVKELVKKPYWNCCFRTSFDSKHVNGSQNLVKSPWDHFYHIFLLFWVEMICNLSPSLNFEILGVFFNTLTADENYPVQDCENL